MTPSEQGLAVLVGPRVTRVFKIRDGRVELPGEMVESRGLIPPFAGLCPDGEKPAWLVSAAETPRVTIDGRATINPEGIRLTADAVVRAGGRLSGPLPSETTAADLFPHELARQASDLVVLTQPIAGDKSRSLARALDRGMLGSCLPIICNGPGGYGSPVPDPEAPCSVITVDPIFTGGRANPGPTRRTLGDAVRAHLKARLVEAGYEDGLPFATVGAAAVRALHRLSEWSREGGAANGPGGNSSGRNAVPTVDVCLVVAELDGAAVFALSGDRLQTGTVEFMGTGTIDLTGRERTHPAKKSGEGRLPDWKDMTERLPFEVDVSDLANITGNTLVRPWSLPNGLAEACLGGALVEELLTRLASNWRNAVGKEAFDLSRARLVAGSGFGLGRLGDVRLAAHALVNAFQPVGITTVVIDPYGVLLLESGAIEAGLSWPVQLTPPEIGAVCVSPLRGAFDWRRATTDPWAIVTVERDDGRVIPRRLVPGSVGSIPLAPGCRATLTVEPCLPSMDFGAGPGRVWKGTVTGGGAGVILDGRGRPARLPTEAGFRVTKQREFLAAFGVLGKEEDRA